VRAVVSLKDLRKVMHALGLPLWHSLRDLLPIVAVVALFQLLVFQQPLRNIAQLLLGLTLIVLGLSLFISGLRLGLFPLGEGMAHDFARKGSVPWLILFAFCLGFGSTFAEPALITIANEAAQAKFADRAGEEVRSAQRNFALALRTTVAIAVGIALTLGVMRVIKGWPVQYFMMAGYLVVMLLTPFTSSQFISIAYDSGGVATSTISVPLITALGVGLASSIQGRNPLFDGFGMIALAAVTPIIFVLGLGIVWP